MSRYKKVRCIACNIKPGRVEGTLVYLGKKSADLDIKKLCTIMKNAVMTAYDELNKLTEGQRQQDQRRRIARGSMNTVVTNPVLTIFMAPEFFFRGPDGAYPLEKIETILPEMAKTVQDPKYKDWLFVYGTAVGYRKIDETITKIASYRVYNSQTVISPDTLSSDEEYTGWLVREYVKANVTGVTKEPSGDFRLSLATTEDFSWCTCLSLVHGEGERTEEFDIKSHTDDRANGKWIVVVGARTTPIQSGWTAELSAGAASVQEVEKDGFDAVLNAQVEKITRAGEGTAQITLDTQNDPGACRHVQFIRPDGTKTTTFPILGWKKDGLNTMIMIKSANQRRLPKCPEAACHCAAFVPDGAEPEKCGTCAHYHVMDPVVQGWGVNLRQRVFLLKGPSRLYTPGRMLQLTRKPDAAETEVFNVAQVQRGGAGARAIAVPKRNYSSIDYIAVEKWSPAKGKMEKTGKFYIEGEERTLVDTEKMAPGGKSVESDMSGDPVFTIDGCTIGLEVCLDHLTKRLEEFYASPVAAGKPKPQIHLIPSWGMSIGRGPVVCKTNGIAFNVDGQRGNSDVRIIDGTYGCDVHLQRNVPGPGNCPDCRPYFCTTCKDDVAEVDRTKAGLCPKCGKSGTLVDLYICPIHERERKGGPGYCSVNIETDPALPPVDCNTPLMHDKEFKPIGRSITPDVESTTVVLRSWEDWLTVTQKNYFLGKGSITVYPELPIPDP